MKKKILSLVLVVAMLASMLVLAPVSGATEFDGTVAVTNAYGFAGEPVSVNVVLTTEKPVYTFQFTFDYDKTKMTLDSVEFAPGFGFWPISGVKDVDEAMKVSPFDNIGWNRAVGADPIDASEGAVIATMNFTLNEDVLGDAYVSIVPSPINNIAIDSGEVGAMIYNFDYIAGAVTALPSGYSTESTLPEINYITQDDVDNEVIEFEYSEDLEGYIITGYTENTYSGVVVFPSAINDDNFDGEYGECPVVEIGFKTVNQDTSADAFIIPESVVQIDMAAFFKCNAMDYYVLNPDCEIGEGAFGATGTCSTSNGWNKKVSGVLTPAGPYVMVHPETGAVPTIHGVAGSTAEEYAAQTFLTDGSTYTVENVNWVASTALPTENTLTFNGTKYYFTSGSEVTIPGASVDGDQLTVAWKIGDTTYLPGDTMTITEDTTLEPVTIAKPDMTSTYGFKPTDSPATTAMRFTTTLAKADYETLAGVAESLGGRVEMGTLITPARYVSLAGGLTKEALNALSASNNNAQTYIDIDTTGRCFSLERDIYTFAGSVYGFKGTNYNLDYAAAFYMSVVVGEGETEETLFTVYSDFEFANNRQPLATAKAVYEVATTNAVKEAVLKFIQEYEPTYGEES